MWKLSSLLAVLVSLATNDVLAQENPPRDDSTRNHVKYHNMFYLEGLPAKDQRGDLGIGMVHGITIQPFSVGVGLSRDFYDTWNVRGVFGSVMLDLFRIREDAAFILLDAGRARTRPLITEDQWLTVRSDHAGMWSLCGGWRRSGERGDLFLAMGIKKQRLKGSYVYRWGGIPNPEMEYRMTETIGRLRIVMAYRFH